MLAPLLIRFAPRILRKITITLLLGWLSFALLAAMGKHGDSHQVYACEQNPVRAKMVRVPWSYPFSSAAAHVGKKDKADLIDM